MSHTATEPSLELRQRRSLLPSPLKSPTPAIIQTVDTWAKTGLAVACAPFIVQIATDPLAVLYQRMSLFPSPLKSPTPAMRQLVETCANTELALTCVPFMTHIAT